MDESKLKGALCDVARQTLKSFVIIRHEDRFTHGIPDISIDGNKTCTWLEVKYANPGFKTKGIQELTMLRLALASHAYFVVYWERNKEKRTYIVDPCDIGKDMNSWERFRDGFNHQWVVEFIKGVHNDNNRS